MENEEKETAAMINAIRATCLREALDRALIVLDMLMRDPQSGRVQARAASVLKQGYEAMYEDTKRRVQIKALW